MQNQTIAFDGAGAVGPADVPFLGGLAFASVNLVAGSIERVQNLSATRISLNARSIGLVSDLTALGTQIVAHQVDEVARIFSFSCLNVQSVGSIHDLAGGVSVFGRSEGGQLAPITLISRFAGTVNFHAVDVAELDGASLGATFTGSHIGHLAHGSGEFWLVDTNIDAIDNFSGTIHLKGTSTINQPIGGAVLTTQY